LFIGATCPIRGCTCGFLNLWPIGNLAVWRRLSAAGPEPPGPTVGCFPPKGQFPFPLKKSDVVRCLRKRPHLSPVGFNGPVRQVPIAPPLHFPSTLFWSMWLFAVCLDKANPCSPNIFDSRCRHSTTPFFPPFPSFHLWYLFRAPSWVCPFVTPCLSPFERPLFSQNSCAGIVRAVLSRQFPSFSTCREASLPLRIVPFSLRVVSSDVSSSPSDCLFPGSSYGELFRSTQ